VEEVSRGSWKIPIRSKIKEMVERRGGEEAPRPGGVAQS